MEERVFIIIDGSNFYHRLKEIKLKNLLRFDYRKFSKFLAGKRKIALKRYYIGAIRTKEGEPKSFELWKNQRKLIGQLQKAGFEIGFGHMLKTDRYHEKGMDVLMAVDLLVGAYEDLYDTAILASSDTDLIPALDKARGKGKKIEYIGFSHNPSYALIAHSGIRRLLRAEDLKGWIA
jgi:uncharacterized LabA/DUF88 family protein